VDSTPTSTEAAPLAPLPIVVDSKPLLARFRFHAACGSGFGVWQMGTTFVSRDTVEAEIWFDLRRKYRNDPRYASVDFASAARYAETAQEPTQVCDRRSAVCFPVGAGQISATAL
jgi:hypothetical protein